MKSRLALLFGVVLTLALTACGGGGGGGTTTQYSTSTSLSASATSVAAGASVTLTASVSSNGGAASGAVSFYEGSTLLGSANLSGSSAAYTVSSIAAGAHSYTASYAGSTNFTGSTSAPVTVTATASAPSAPTGLSASGATGSVSLSWTAVSGATSYAVKRSTTSGSGYATIGSPTANSYVDSSATNGVRYYYVVTAGNSSGDSAASSEASATPVAAPANVTASASGASVQLNWAAVTGATGYVVKRSTTSGSGYATIGSPTANSYVDSSLAAGTYYYVIQANGLNSTSSPSAQVGVSATSSSAINVTVDATKNRHAISPYIYGYNFPDNAAYIASAPGGLVRWGGNASSNYNYTNGATNAAADWYYQNRPFNDKNDPLYSSAAEFVTDTISHGGAPITTLPMLDYVAKDGKASSYSFSIAKYGAQCKVNPYYADDGNGVKSDCSTNVTGNNVNDAYVPFLDEPGSNDPSGAVYRSKFVTDSLLPAFQSGSTPHFYNMDNEIDIWGGTHRDVHPSPTTYSELSTTFIREARALKGWDPNAVTFGPVSCCWWFYWNSAAGSSDKAAHGGIDFLPYWLNEVRNDAIIHGSSALDVFDIHAYADQPDTSSYTTAQKQALAASLARDFWDPTYVSGSTTVTQPWATSTQTNYSHPFRIPRLRAMLNAHLRLPIAFTEWNAAVAGESDFSTALYDADMYGVFGREEVFAASRWTAAASNTPAYQALKLFVNPTGSGGGFETTSVDCANNGNANLFSCYAAVNAAGTRMTVVVINKDPANVASANLSFNGFTPSSFVAYTLIQAAPDSISVSAAAPWSSGIAVAPYSITLLSITGATTNPPASEWQFYTDAIQAPAAANQTLKLYVPSGSTGAVTINSATMDNGVVSGAAGSSIVISQNTASRSGSGSDDAAITFVAPATSDFYRITVKGTDANGSQQTKQAWLIVGPQAGSLSAVSSNPTGAAVGASTTIAVKFDPGNSGATASGVTLLFASQNSNIPSGEATTDSTGVASYTFTQASGGATFQVTPPPQWGSTGVAVAVPVQ